MSNGIIFGALLAAAIASGIVGGIFYAFSSFIMAGLARVPSDHGAAAMRSINVTVINPSFMAVFLGTTFASVLLTGWALFDADNAAAVPTLIASLLYLGGCFGVTMMFNVPLNNRLASVEPADEPALWAHYLRVWTRWNTVRTIAPLISSALFVVALVRS
jgi:uncharacterized membrane protein